MGATSRKAWKRLRNLSRSSMVGTGRVTQAPLAIRVRRPSSEPDKANEIFPGLISTISFTGMDRSCDHALNNINALFKTPKNVP